MTVQELITASLQDLRVIQTGEVVSADDAEATSAAATEVLKNSQLAASLAAAARERIINTFPLERAAANMAREYRELRSL